MKRLPGLLVVIVGVLGGTVPQSQAQDVREGVGDYAASWRLHLPLANRLARRVDFDGVNDPKLTLYDVLNDFALRHELTIDVDELAFRQAGCRYVLDQRVVLTPIPAMKDVPLSDVLRAILARIPSPSRATFIYRRDLIEITTHRQAANEGRRGVADLLVDFGERLQFVGYRIRYRLLEGEGFDWTDVEEHTEKVGELLRDLGEISYWGRVMSENARAALEEAARAAERGNKGVPGQNHRK